MPGFKGSWTNKNFPPKIKIFPPGLIQMLLLLELLLMLLLLLLYVFHHVHMGAGAKRPLTMIT